MKVFEFTDEQADELLTVLAEYFGEGEDGSVIEPRTILGAMLTESYEGIKELETLNEEQQNILAAMTPFTFEKMLDMAKNRVRVMEILLA